jgi:acetolactate synthase-1/2/3 large subunit
MSNLEPDAEVQETVLTEPEMGDLLVAYLNQLGIEYVFGVPGGAIEPLYNALARSERQDSAAY